MYKNVFIFVQRLKKKMVLIINYIRCKPLRNDEYENVKLFSCFQ